MAYINLYVDTYSGELVSGVENFRAGLLPRFFQGDTISLRIYLLERTSTFPVIPAYAIINNALLDLKVALGPKNGTAGSTLYTQQLTWDKDAQKQYFFADLPLSTAAITTLIGTAESASAWFEIQYEQNGVPTTVLQKSVTIHAEVIESGVITVPAGLTGASVEYVNATFLKAENNGFVMVNPTTGSKIQVYLGDDGAVHFDPIA